MSKDPLEECMTCGRTDKNPDSEMGFCDFCKCHSCKQTCFRDNVKSGPSYPECEECFLEANPEEADNFNDGDYGWGEYRKNSRWSK